MQSVREGATSEVLGASSSTIIHQHVSGQGYPHLATHNLRIRRIGTYWYVLARVEGRLIIENVLAIISVLEWSEFAGHGIAFEQAAA